jgi:hypothetical protein
MKIAAALLVVPLSGCALSKGFDRAKRKAIEEFGRKLVARLTHLQP